MLKLSWIDGYCEALVKLGWSPERVMQIKQMLAKEVPAAHALHAKMTAQRAGMLQQSPKIREMAFGVGMTPKDFSMMTLGQKAPAVRATAIPPVPQAVRQAS